MGFFTIKLQHWNLIFSILAMAFCVIGRIMNIFPLSFIANMCRSKRNPSNRITWKMQFVLWFAGLRGAIAFALALNMPGPNAELYTTVTLTICAVTTVICGGFTEKILDKFGMKETESVESDNNEESKFDAEEDEEQTGFFTDSPIMRSRNIRHAYDGLKGLWSGFDNLYLKPMFGGSSNPRSPSRPGKRGGDGLGHYELGTITDQEDEDEKDRLWQE